MNNTENFANKITHSRTYRLFEQGIREATSLADLRAALLYAVTETIGTSGIILFPLYRGAVPRPDVIVQSDHFPKEAAGKKTIEALPIVDRELGLNGEGSIAAFLSMEKKARNFVEHYGRPYLETTWTYTEFFRSLRADEVIASVLGTKNAPLGFIGLTRTFDESPFSEQDVATAERIRSTLELGMSRVVRSYAEKNPFDQFLNILYEIIPDPCALVDVEGRPLWANRAAVEKLGEDLWQIKEGCFVFSNGTRRDRWRNAVRRTISHESTTRDSQGQIVVHRIERIDGEALYFIRETESGSEPEERWRFLSAREQEIARLAAEGYTSVNIGAELSITEGTVRNHLKKIYKKLHISSRVELAISLRLTR